MTDKQPKIEEQMNNYHTIENNTLPNIPKALQDDCKDDDQKSNGKPEEGIATKVIKTLEKFRSKKIWSPQLEDLYNDLKEDYNTEKYPLEEISLKLKQLQEEFSVKTMIEKTNNLIFTEKKTKNSIHQTSMGNLVGRSEIDGKNNYLKIESKEEKCNETWIEEESIRGTTEIYLKKGAMANNLERVEIGEKYEESRSKDETIMIQEQRIIEQNKKIEELEKRLEENGIHTLSMMIGNYLSDKSIKNNITFNKHIILFAEKLIETVLKPKELKQLESFHQKLSEDPRCNEFKIKCCVQFVKETLMKESIIWLFICYRHNHSHILSDNKKIYLVEFLLNQPVIWKVLQVMFLVVPHLEKFIRQVCGREVNLIDKIMNQKLLFSKNNKDEFCCECFFPSLCSSINHIHVILQHLSPNLAVKYKFALIKQYVEDYSTCKFYLCPDHFYQSSNKKCPQGNKCKLSHALILRHFDEETQQKFRELETDLF